MGICDIACASTTPFSACATAVASPASPVSSDPKVNAVVCNSVASPCHADAAASIGPAPGPEYTSAELISGGNCAKSSMSARA
jgi:hypothetical protein